MPIKAIMVDVDGVIVVHSDPRGWSANLERDLGLSASRFQEAFFKPHFNDIVHGRAELHERLELVLAEIAPHLSVETLTAYWFEHDADFDHDLLAQLAEIRARGVQLHLATVQEHSRANYLWRTVGLCRLFDGMHYSAELGWVKPAAEFYVAVERRTGFQPDDLFFIDDRTENVEAARARGWRAATWTGERRLADLMGEAGL